MSLFDNPFDPAREAALVTGAGNGIGRAIAQALVGEGVRTVFADVSADTVDGGGQSLSRGRNWRVPWVGDLASRAACDALLADAQSRGRAGDALRSQRLAAAARGRSCVRGEPRDLGADARGQCRCRLSPRARTGANS